VFLGDSPILVMLTSLLVDDTLSFRCTSSCPGDYISALFMYAYATCICIRNIYVREVVIEIENVIHQLKRP